MRKGNFTLTAIIVIVILIIGAGALYTFVELNKKSLTPPQSETMCTTDAMQCPDGSFVGRQEPNCEFAPCPSTTTQFNEPIPSNWQMYTSPKFNYTFSYPSTWELNPYDETNPQITMGTHSLSSYSMNAITNYMDHGMVNWKSFLGNQAAVKLDITFQNDRTLTPEAFEQQLFYSEETPPQVIELPSEVRIGNLPTKKFQIVSPQVGEGLFSLIYYYVFYPSTGPAFIGAFVANTTEAQLPQTQTWQDFLQVLRSFELR